MFFNGDISEIEKLSENQKVELLLELASQDDDESLVAIECLVKNHRINIDSVNKSGNTALIEACRLNCHNNTDLLLKLGADPLIMANNGKAAIHFACHLNHHEIVDMLVTKNPEIATQESGEGWQPIHFAARENSDTRIVETLLKNGAGINSPTKDSNSASPLMLAIYNTFPMAVNFLLEQPEINVNQMDSLQHSALWHAIKENKGDLVQTLVFKGSAVSEEMYKLAGNNRDIVTILNASQAATSLETARASRLAMGSLERKAGQKQT